MKNKVPHTTTLEEGKRFIEKVGYPVVVKPDNGVGAAATYKISNEEELMAFYNEEHITQYIMEEFVNGFHSQNSSYLEYIHQEYAY